MDAYQTPVDIGNRACDHWGSLPVDPTLGFSGDTSRAAQFLLRSYDKLRQAELRRRDWSFAIKTVTLRAIDTNTMMLAPVLWSATTTYFRGMIVADANGRLWISNIPNNTGNQPEVTVYWDEYFGPLTVALYDTTGGTSYNVGELVYTAPGDGTSRTYMSLITGNSDVPSTSTPWAATSTYFKNQVVTYLSVAYMSLTDLNINQTPTASPANWAVGTTYALNALVNGSDGVTYKSLANGNVGNNPTTDAGVHWLNTGVLTPWTSVFVGGTGSLNWLQIGGAEFPNGVTLQTLNIIYPLGSGPITQSWSRNAYRLPAAFLRRAPDDPKAGSMSQLGVPSNNPQDDYNFEGRYVTTFAAGPLMLRFVADLVDVSQMDPMFCEGLGARIGLEGCEFVTQSMEKKQAIASEYQKFMEEARTADSILVGPVEPPLDDFIACRA